MTRKVSLAILIMLAAPLASDVSLASRATPAVAHEHATRRLVRLMPHSGPPHLANLVGVGCTEAICSRIAIRLLGDDVGEQVDTLVDFETITAIRLHDAGRPTVDLANGASRRVVIPIDNRVLYLSDDSHRSEKLDVGELAAIEFLR